VKTKASKSGVVGYEILRRVAQSEVPDIPIDPRNERAVLGSRESRYLVPPNVDIFELGLLTNPGQYELLPIDADDKPLWNVVVNLLVTEAHAQHQRALLMRAYRALHAMIREADELESSIDEWSRRGETHPIFGMLRLATIDVWRSNRRGREPLADAELDALHREVGRRVARKIRAHLIRR
jgi:hypothetical protein